jgi:hypothetical protein
MKHSRAFRVGTLELMARENEPPGADATPIVGVRRQPERLIAVIPVTLAEERDQLRFGPAPTPFAHDLVDPAQEQRAAPARPHASVSGVHASVSGVGRCLYGQNASSRGHDNCVPTGFVESDSSCPPGAKAGRASRRDSWPARVQSVARPARKHQGVPADGSPSGVRAAPERAHPEDLGRNVRLLRQQAMPIDDRRGHVHKLSVRRS